MKKINQIKIMYWAKVRHKVNPKYLRRSLTEKKFDELCLILQKVKHIGSIFNVKEVVKEFIEEHGIEYIPKSFSGVDVDLTFFFNTHETKEDGFIEVDLYHILLSSWCRPTRENFRVLKKHLKNLGYSLKTETPTYKNKQTALVSLKENYPLSLPKNLKKYVKPIKWCKSISEWIYLNDLEIKYENEPYVIENIGERWEAYFIQKFIELFKSSEIEFLYKHPQVRECYEDAPPVLALCEITLREVFKPTKLKEWIYQVLTHTELESYVKGCEENILNAFIDTVHDEICSKLSKTMVKGVSFENYDSVSGWNSIIVICYVKDTIKNYKELS